VSVVTGGTARDRQCCDHLRDVCSVSNSLTLAGHQHHGRNKTGSVILNARHHQHHNWWKYGGTLQLNLTGTALAAGECPSSLRLQFGHSAFAAIIPAAPGIRDLLWDTDAR